MKTKTPMVPPNGPDVPEPHGPDTKEPEDNKTLSSPINELEKRLFDQRKVLIFGAINDKVARGRHRAPAGPRRRLGQAD